MTKQKNKPSDNVSRLKKVVVVTGIFVSLFGGMFAAIVAIDNFKNYDSPYLFGFLFGIIGLVAGLLVANKLKSHIIINHKIQQNYSLFTIHIATGFIGLAMLLGQLTNTTFATKLKCDNYTLANKLFRKGGYNQIELNILVINVDGVYHRFITNPNYWQSVTVGQQVNVCIYKSKIGFDFIKLTNEK